VISAAAAAPAKAASASTSPRLGDNLLIALRGGNGASNGLGDMLLELRPGHPRGLPGTLGEVLVDAQVGEGSRFFWRVFRYPARRRFPLQLPARTLRQQAGLAGRLDQFSKPALGALPDLPCPGTVFENATATIAAAVGLWRCGLTRLS
jgi:hypothetical protein